MKEHIALNPIFFERNKVFRVYKGGKLFNDFFGDEAVDSNFPEEWIASCVEAKNKESHAVREGVSKLEDTDIYFDEFIEKNKNLLLGDRQKLDVLVKILDSAIRLPVQAHPNKTFSEKHFNSKYGKAESWLILEIRENAKIYFGFKEKINKEEFAMAVEKSKAVKNAMPSYINEIPAKKGDVYFIPAKMVHAIGYGCLILEVQEPTDFTVQPEKWCGDYELNDYEMYLGLNKSTALDCFDYNVFGSDAIKLGKRNPQKYQINSSSIKEEIITENDTPCFALNRYTISSGTLNLSRGPSIFIVTEGNGVLKNGDYIRQIKKGDYFFMPYCVTDCTLETEKTLQLVECLPPKTEA